MPRSPVFVASHKPATDSSEGVSCRDGVGPNQAAVAQDLESELGHRQTEYPGTDKSHHGPPRFRPFQMRSYWHLYCVALETFPLETKAVVMAVGLATGDLLAAHVTGKPLNQLKMFHMALFGLIFQGPGLHFLYMVLDRYVCPDKPTSPRAVLTKLCIDQLGFAPVSTIMFFTLMELFNGRPEGVVGAIQRGLFPTLCANYCLWPAALLINYRYTPPRHRILYVNFVTIIWGMLLSMVASGTM